MHQLGSTSVDILAQSTKCQYSPHLIICHNPAQQHLRAASGRDHPVRWDLGDAPRPHKQQLSLDTDFLCVPVGGNRLVRKKPNRSLAKATSHAMPNSTNAILSLPPQHARRVIDLGKDVSREQRARHQVTLGEESPAPAEENEPQGRRRMKRRKITIIK